MCNYGKLSYGLWAFRITLYWEWKKNNCKKDSNLVIFTSTCVLKRSKICCAFAYLWIKIAPTTWITPFPAFSLLIYFLFSLKMSLKHAFYTTTYKHAKKSASLTRKISQVHFSSATLRQLSPNYIFTLIIFERGLMSQFSVTQHFWAAKTGGISGKLATINSSPV